MSKRRVDLQFTKGFEVANGYEPSPIKNAAPQKPPNREFSSPMTALATDMSFNLSVRQGSNIKTPRLRPADFIRKALANVNDTDHDEPVSPLASQPILRHSHPPCSPMDHNDTHYTNEQIVAPDIRLSSSPLSFTGPFKRGNHHKSHWLQRSRAIHLSRSMEHMRLPRPVFPRLCTEPTLLQRKRQLAPTSTSRIRTIDSDDEFLYPEACGSSGTSCSRPSSSLPPLKMRRTQSCSAVGSDKDTTFNLTTDPELDSALLPWFPGRSDSHKRISGETLGHLLDGHFDDKVDEYYILDCRFPYEFNGGHIATARNINTKSELIDLFFKPPRSEKNVVVVFHCEFSSHRAPRMASFMRKYDRQLNIETYPNLHYPEIYVLEGGYRRFYSEFKARCTPQKYVEMVDPAFIHDLKTSKAAHRREFGRSASQSYVGGNC